MKTSVCIAVLVLFAVPSAFAQGAKPAEPAKKADPAKPAEPAKKGDAAKPAEPAKAEGAAAAQGAPPPPAEELTAVGKWFEGNWKCAGKRLASHMGPEAPTKGKYTSKADLNGYWLSMRYEEQKAKDNPKPYVSALTVGWDPSKKQLVRTDIDGMGGITHSTSPGWSGDTMVFSGEAMMGPQKAAWKHTITKKGDKEFTSAVEMAGPDGKLAPMTEGSCKK